MGNNKQGQNLDFVGMSSGGYNVRARKDGMELEPQNPNPVVAAAAPGRAKGVVPLETPEEDAEARAEREAAAKAAAEEAEQRLRERIREELKAEVTAEVRAEVEADLKAEDEKKEDAAGLAKASPTFKEIEPQAKASEEDLDQAIEDNTEEVD
jgi:hypothetical protein